MFNCQHHKKYYQISFNNDELNFKENKVLYEDELILIDRFSLKNFCKYFGITLDSETFKLKIKLSDFKTKTNFIESKSHIEEYIRKRFKQSELAACFFKKHLFPKDFSLKDYQIEGINWLLRKNGRLLADDMGLGKTAQSIVAASKLIRSTEIKNVLIVCPRSLMQNWADELEIWAQSFKCYVVHSEVNSERLWKGIISYGHFFIINYDQARKLCPTMLSKTPDLIICDEAHKLRKKKSLVHSGLKEISLNTKRFWALTGTPIEKDTNDLVSLMQLIRPNAYNSSVRKLPPSSIKGMMMKNVLRRLKSDVLKDLSDLREKTVYIRLNDEQQQAYNVVIKSVNTRNKTELLKTFNTLRQICDDFEGRSSKYDYAVDLIEKIKQKEEKVVIFSYTLKPLEEMEKRINNLFGKDSSLIYEGKMEINERNAAIKSFKQSSSTFALLCSGKIAGEGLNLTEANNVIFLNEWWNPSSNNQARDRVYRIGQRKDVSIFNLRTKNTVEESLDIILKEKKEITNDVIESMVLKGKDQHNEKT